MKEEELTQLQMFMAVYGMTLREAHDIYGKMRVMSMQHHHLAEEACNRDLTDKEERRMENIYKAFVELVKCLPKETEPFHQGDPRGVTLGLILPKDENGRQRYNCLDNTWRVF